MQMRSLNLSGLQLISPKVFSDERGFFFESYREPFYSRLGSFVQDNVSFSKKGTIRALHYQEGPGQAKLVSCLQGEIFDVAVDLRPNSPTFQKWEGVILNGVLHEQLFIPAGFAHGYCVLSDDALVHYKVSTVYDPSLERSIRWNDPKIQIAWPIENPILSLRDQESPFFEEVFR